MDAMTDQTTETAEPARRGRRRKAPGRRRKANALVIAIQDIPPEDRRQAITNALRLVEEEERRPELLARLHELSTGDLEHLLAGAH